MLDFTRRLSTPSKLRYALWKLTENGTSALDLTLSDGTRFRHCAADYGSAYQVFVEEVYRPGSALKNADVRMIVDLGANVGFTALYFLQQFPGAKLLAFEPHPAHIERFLANIALNGVDDKVTLYRAGAGNKASKAGLSDLGTSSTVQATDAPGAFNIDILDIFEILGNHRIDLLKIDIEGGEYDILADDRFLKLDVGSIVMEWHRNKAIGDEHAWLVDRLGRAGYVVEDIFADPHLGMLWAHHANPS